MISHDCWILHHFIDVQRLPVFFLFPHRLSLFFLHFWFILLSFSLTISFSIFSFCYIFFLCDFNLRIINFILIWTEWHLLLGDSRCAHLHCFIYFSVCFSLRCFVGLFVYLSASVCLSVSAKKKIERFIGSWCITAVPK